MKNKKDAWMYAVVVVALLGLVGYWSYSVGYNRGARGKVHEFIHDYLVPDLPKH